MRNGFEDLDLARPRQRRSEKWRAYPPDVLPAMGDANNPPVYPPFFAQITGRGPEVAEVPLVRTNGRWTSTSTRSRRRSRSDCAGYLLLLCHPHNPTERYQLRQKQAAR